MDCFKRLFTNDIYSIPDMIMDNDEDRMIFILSGTLSSVYPFSLRLAIGLSLLLYVRTVLFACLA